MKKLLSAILSVVMIASAFFCVDLSAYAFDDTAQTEGVVDYSNLTQNQYVSKVLLNYNYLGEANNYDSANSTPEFQQLEYWLEPSNVSFARILVNALNENSDFVSSVEAWKILTFNPSNLADDVFKEEDYYTTILLSILDAKVSDNEFIKDLNCSANKTITSLSKNTAKILKEFCDIDIENLENVNVADLTDSQYTNLMEQIAQTKDAKGLYDAIGNDIGYISDATKLCKTVADIVKTVSMYSTLNESSKATETVLKTICDNCPTDNAAMFSASQKVYEYVTGALTENMITMMESGEAVFSTAFDEIVGKLWSAALTTTLGSFGTGVLIGQAVGKAISNFAFSTDDTIDKYYAMSALVQFEDVIIDSVNDLIDSYENSETSDAADEVLRSVELMLATYNLGYDYTNDFAEIVFEKGFVNSIKNLYGKSKNLTDIKADINSIKSSTLLAYGLVSVNTYKYYMEIDAPGLYDAIYGTDGEDLDVPIVDMNVVQTKELSIGDEGPTYDFFSVTYSPENNTETVLGEYVSSSDESVIKIDDNGCIGGYLYVVGEGECTLTFTSYNGKHLINIDLVVDCFNLENDDEWDYSGKCGDDVIWRLNITTGNLVISGNGAMYNYSYTSNGASSPTWSKYCSYIKNITIKEGVTRIGSSEFVGCINLERVTIPDSVTSIGNSAFYNCSRLKKTNYNGTIDQWAEISFSLDGTANPVYYSKNLYIDNKLVTNANFSKATKINLSSFEYCNSLTSIMISDSVTSIETWAFYGCENLKSVVIGNSITSIGERAFQYCTSLINITIGNSIVDLSGYMFYGCDSLTRVTLGNGIMSIGYETFYNCKNLKEIMIPNSVNSIGKYAFNGCASLQNVFYSGSETSWKKILEMYNRYGDNCLGSANISYNCCNNCYSPNFDSGEISKAATCQETGIMIYTCTKCGATKTETIDKLDHKYHKLTIKNPTCTENGVEYFECSVCGDIYERTPLHDITIDSSLYPESSHNYSNSTNQTYDFSYDGAKKLVVTFSPKTKVENNYDYIYIYDDENNQIGKYTGTTLASQSFIIQGDSFHIKLTSDSSNTYYGFSFSSIVATIGDENATELLATGHNYVSTVTEPTCTKQGYTTYKCSLCGEEYIDNYVPATGHSIVDGVCNYCGENSLIESGEIKTVTIDFEEEYKYYYFTPKESNYYTFYSMGECDVIGVLLDENFEFITGDYTEATNNFSFTHYCESGKQYILLCTMSDQNSLGTFQITLEQHVHSYNKTFVDPTCTEDGYTIYSCSCGDSFTSDYVSATGHNFVDNVCINCGLEKPDILGTLEIDVPYKLNVSDDLGYYYYFSTGDNSIFDITYQDSECEIAFLNTDENNSFYENCSVVDSGSIALENNSTYIVRIVTYGASELTISNHQHHYTKVVYEPTCTSEGYTNYICDCAPGYSSLYSDDFVEALGHNYVDNICTRCGKTKFDYEYELLDDGTISITQYTGTETDVVVPATIDGLSVKEVSYSAFDGCETVKSVTFSEGVEAIYCSFSNCPALETIYIPSTVSDFELIPFSNEITFESGDNNENFVTEVHSGNLKNISVSNDNPYFCSVDGVLFSKNMDTLIRYPSGKSDTVYEIPNTVKSFSSLAFAYAGNLSSIIISESVENIQNEIFCLANNITMGGYGNIIDTESNFKGFEVNTNNANYCSVNGVLYSKDMGTLIAYPNGKTDENFVTNDQVEEIGMMAFAFTQVKNIKLSNVQTTSPYAFYQSGFLETVEFSDNCKSIGYGSFIYCSSLEEIDIPAGVTFDGGEVFAYCLNLKKVSLPTGLEEIGNYMFIYCINLSEVFIPSSVKNISPSAFTTCDNLKTVYYSGSQAQWNNISIGADNSCLTDATIHYNWIEIDTDALTAAIEMFDNLNPVDYSTQSYSNLSIVVEEYRTVLQTAQSQQEIDDAVTAILEVMYDLVPYLNLNISAENGSYQVQYDSSISSDSEHSLVFGTEVTLTATANDGYDFVGWYDETSGVYLSKESTYTFSLTANMDIKAVFVEEQSATLTFTTYSDWLKEEITKTVDEWNEITSIEDMLPEVPYRYGYSNGRWVYDNEDVLAKLRAGENVSIVAEYDADDASLPTPPTHNGDVPVLDLYYKLDTDENIGSFVMATGIPENCQIESVGMAYYYKNANQFNPENFELLLNNKMLTSTFDLDDSNIYIANIERFTSKNNWSVRGYITYYDADSNLKTVYSNQINIVRREQV